ncbi:unnamed protein product [Trifolium pratense]|uniref:Uncharacterized protein n=1 Tax=Trifolium pratense TaxID=57577 RepID=A0ACB0LA13_TRIPR|nr:unnamed protein product [Trifolium pratense]
MSSNLSIILPRVLIVSRRTLRKNKFVDFVGEYHLDLIVAYGAVPVIVPRVSGVRTLLNSFEPIHGVLLCEGEDIDPSWYEQDNTTCTLSHEELEEIKKLHSSDTNIDKEKDSIELSLAKLCLERNIPYLGICRGSQVLNVASGDMLLRFVKNTPLYDWFKDSLKNEGMDEILVNSYHHQGVKRLAQRFVPMAFANDGLIEGFYDPCAYNPDEGKFIMGLQFHPERMRKPNSDDFDYPGCPFVYKEFVKAVIVYQKRLNILTSVPKPMKLNKEMKNKRNKIIMRSFSLAKNLYATGRGKCSSKHSEFEIIAEFLESNTSLSVQQENRLKQMGATVRNGGLYVERLKKLNEEREKRANNVMEKMAVEQLSDLLSFYHNMGKICSQILETKLNA